jgi:MFS family permease
MSVLVRLCLALFLVSLEVSIVSTSLVAITNSLQGFSQSSWIVTAYLLTYTGKNPLRVRSRRWLIVL